MALKEPCRSCILLLEHEIFQEAFGEWAGFNRESAMEDLNYLAGVSDFVGRAIGAMTGGDEESTMED